MAIELKHGEIWGDNMEYEIILSGGWINFSLGRINASAIYDETISLDEDQTKELYGFMKDYYESEDRV